MASGVKFSNINDFKRMARAVRSVEQQARDAVAKPNVPPAAPIIPGVIFRVSLTNTSGSNGTKTTTASWLYTATSLTGVSLGTNLSPEEPRPNGTRSAATSGSGYFNSSGTFTLYEAKETPGTGSC